MFKFNRRCGRGSFEKNIHIYNLADIYVFSGSKGRRTKL